MAAAAVAGLAFAASQAQADDFTGTFSTTYHGTDPGLVIQVAPPSGTFSFSLSSAAPVTTPAINLFTIYTNESSVDLDDLIPYGFDLSLNLTDTTIGADLGGDFGGATGGTVALGFFRIIDESGYLVWADGGKKTLDFGNGGELTVQLTDPVGFNLANGSKLKPGLANGATVAATFDWTASPTVGTVPEPASWALMIGGFGMAGGMLRRRRTTATAA
jgi:PEP-CTERM motif